MPIVFIPFVIAGFFLLVILLLPLAIVQRYRVGTSRRQARGCLAMVNVVSFAISAVMVVATAMVTSLWEPQALPYVAAGLAGGGLLGVLGLALGRWEETDDGLYVTPARWLVLAIVLVVVARIGYGFWRAWQVVSTGSEDESWLAATGVSGALAAGALVIGYSLVYWLGVRRRVDRYRRRGRSAHAVSSRQEARRL